MIKLEKEKGITLIALVITIIVMLILVGVTITVAMQGELFGTARKASRGTQIQAEKEKLWTAGMGAMGENGEIDFSKLDENLPDGFTGNNGSYTIGENSYIIDRYGKITVVGENTEGSIAGRYSYLEFPGETTNQGYIEFYENGKGKLCSSDETGEIIYEYDTNSKQGVIMPILNGEPSEEDRFPFAYSTVIENGNIVNEMLQIVLSYEEFFPKNKNVGLTTLSNNVYVNGNTTIEFGTENIDGETWGTYLLKENGVPVDRWQGHYVCYNGIGRASGLLGNFSVSEDYSSITIWYNGADLVFTKQ